MLFPVSALGAVILGIGELLDIPATQPLRDSNAVPEGPFYVGFFSTIGIALWVAASAVCILVLSTGVSESPRELLIAGAETAAHMRYLARRVRPPILRNGLAALGR